MSLVSDGLNYYFENPSREFQQAVNTWGGANVRFTFVRVG